MESPIAAPNPYDLTGKIDLQDLTLEFTGTYSWVFKGTLYGKAVAVKAILVIGGLTSVRRRVKRERVVWASLSHKNIHPFYGFADDKKFGACETPFGALISPWCNDGDAGRFLREHGRGIPLARRIELWKGVVDGVSYLHDHAIVHGDLKPGNVLIDELGTPRICDFGLSRIFLDHPGAGLNTTSEHTGTERYLAPELLLVDGIHPNAACDVYALGCIGLDFVYLKRPYSHRLNNLRGGVFMDIKNGIPPAKDPPQPLTPVWTLFEKCWSFRPVHRPSAMDTARTVRAITFTFPPTIIARIVMHAAEEEYPESGDDGETVTEADRDTWRKRNQLLGRLCLVSKAFHSYATPFIYKDIRIYLDPELIALSSLIATLKAATGPAASGQRNNGSHSKSLVIYLGSRSHGMDETDPLDIEKASFGVLALIHLLPAVTSAVITRTTTDSAVSNSVLETAPNSHVSACRSLTSVHIRGLGSSIVLSWLSNLQRLPDLQWLNLQLLPEPQVSALIPEGLLRKALSFPNLHELVIQEQCASEDVVTGMRAIGHLLTAASIWAIPRLASLRITSLKLDAFDIPAFKTFLQAHGSLLDSLALDARNYPESLLAAVLLHCGNLRSIVFPVSNFSDFYNPGLSLSHGKLERATLVCSGGHNSALIIPSQKMLKRFRMRTKRRYIKLAEVKLEIWSWYNGDVRTLKWSASFRTDNKAVDILRARFIYQHNNSMSSLSLRSGNSSPPTSVSGA